MLPNMFKQKTGRGEVSKSEQKLAYLYVRLKKKFELIWKNGSNTLIIFTAQRLSD